jgi:hypothetical protein
VVKDWADLVKDNRIGPLLRDLGEALEGCEDPELIRKATRIMVNMGYSASTMLHLRNKENRSNVGKLGDDNGG